MLRQRAGQRRRARTSAATGALAGQRGRRRRRQLTPVAGGFAVGGRRQFLAQRRTQRRLQPGRHGERIDHRRPAFAILDRQHLGERLRLGRELRPRRFGARTAAPAQPRRAAAAAAPRLLDRLQRRAGGAASGGGARLLLAVGRREQRGIDRLAGDPLALRPRA